MRICGGIIFVLGILISWSGLSKDALGERQTAAHVQSASKSAVALIPSTSAKTTLADFAWLIGRWQGAWGPRLAQQVWMPPKAGVMLGTLQIAENDQTQVIELFSISENADGIEYRLLHFTPALMTWEKSAPVVLRLTSINPKTIIFENSGNNQPKHSIITPLDADTYISRSEIAPAVGDIQITEITYHRQKDAPPPRH